MNDLQTASQERFKQALKLSLESIESIKTETDNAFQCLSELGYVTEEAKRSMGQVSFFEFIDANGLQYDQHVQALAKKCKRAHQRGETITPNQLLLRLPDDEAESLTVASKEIRTRDAKWIRGINQVSKDLQAHTKLKPIKEWTDFEKRQVLAVMTPIIEMHKEIKNSTALEI